jgi:hypothetical protein
MVVLAGNFYAVNKATECANYKTVRSSRSLSHLFSLSQSIRGLIWPDYITYILQQQHKLY